MDKDDMVFQLGSEGLKVYTEFHIDTRTNQAEIEMDTQMIRFLYFLYKHIGCCKCGTHIADASFFQGVPRLALVYRPLGTCLTC